jgi:hypothetical protein
LDGRECYVDDKLSCPVFVTHQLTACFESPCGGWPCGDVGEGEHFPGFPALGNPGEAQPVRGTRIVHMSTGRAGAKAA